MMHNDQSIQIKYVNQSQCELSVEINIFFMLRFLKSKLLRDLQVVGNVNVMVEVLKFEIMEIEGQRKNDLEKCSE